MKLFDYKGPAHLAVIHNHLQVIQSGSQILCLDDLVVLPAYIRKSDSVDQFPLCIEDPQQDLLAAGGFHPDPEEPVVRIGVDVQVPDGSRIVHVIHPEFQLPGFV